MRQHTHLLLVGLATAAMPVDMRSLAAQSFGPPDPAMIFNFVDRNQDGRLDNDEIENSRGSLRDRLREAGVDYSRGLSRDDFIRHLERSRESEGDRNGSYRGGSDQGSDDDRRREEERRRDEDRGESRSRDSRSGSSSSSSKPQPKVRVTLDLQQSFKDGDRDFDGQIAFYEWRQWKGRSQSAEFARLDINGDGFVTPREIERAAATPPATVVVSTGPVPPATPAGIPAAPTPTGLNPPAVAPSTSTTPQPTPTVEAQPNPAIAAIVIDENSPSVRRYRSSFQLLDRDHSDSITAEEWERSTNIRGRLAAAHIDLTQPMNGDTFVKSLLFLDGMAGGS